MKERVVFEANVPVSAMLAYADGLKVQGRFGDQVMYSLADGRVMYVPPIVRDKLVELGIRQNEPFAICRAERREGNRRSVEWVVQPNGTAAPSQSVAAHNDPSGSPLNGDNGTRVRANGNGNGNGKPANAPTSLGTAETALRAALTASIGTPNPFAGTRSLLQCSMRLFQRISERTPISTIRSLVSLLVRPFRESHVLPFDAIQTKRR
jgi:hypothetical protein